MRPPQSWARRLLSGACAALLLISLVASSFFIAFESDHDCDGDDCPICLQLNACLDNLHQTGVPTPTEQVQVEVAAASFEPTVGRDYRAPSVTLQSLYVRMDE